jgi:hypothetical protein
MATYINGNSKEYYNIWTEYLSRLEDIYYFRATLNF